MALLLTMMVCFNLVCILVIGIMIYLLKKRRAACMPSMASTSTQIVSSSSFSTSPRKYDVFLSFYGKDTRKNFTDHLYAALNQRGILVFRDEEKLERGKYISDEFSKAIQESMYGIAVISTNYAFSKWCLIELAEMVECMRDSGRLLPIFYHVHPSDIGNQRGAFAKAFGRHEKDPKVDIQMISKWRAALKEVSKCAGWHVHDGYESIVVKEISRRILNGLTRNFSNFSKGFVGIESRVEEMMTLLSMGLNDVRLLGIYGMGGIGKTTLSKAIYERVSHQFEATCYIANIREETRTHGLLYLQKQLIYDILMEREINIWNDYGASRVIASRLQSKKVFIVLDDVDGVKQLEALAGSRDWFGPGSRIIITSRDRHLLNRFVNNSYEVKMLNNADALQLFSWKAFKKCHPEENYVQLSMDIVNYAQGLPLALEVFGSFLFGRRMDAWKSAEDLLKENPNAEILDILEISFNGLEELQKQLFLDIACFFNGANIHRTIHKLESFGYHPNINIKVLVDKSLITIEEDSLRMHDLLQKMGQEIVSCKSTKKLGERSRLWHYENVLHVLKNDTGTDAVKGISLKLPLQKQERLNVEAFSKMKQLQMLHIGVNKPGGIYYNIAHDNLRTNVEWHGNPSNFMLSNELCAMEWWGYPLESLPASFQSNKLVELIMPTSCIKQLWDGRKSFDKLKCIRLSYAKNLIETPDLSGVPNLEQLELEYCTSLCKVHPSIGFLKRLEGLYLHGCKRLKRLPDEMISLSSLVSLDISHCSRLEEIPKYMISGMKCLEYLRVGGSARRKFLLGSEPYRLLIPNSFSCLSSLRYLELSYCNLSDGAIPSDLNWLSSLWNLHLSWLLSNLEWLDLSYCNLLDGAIPNDLSCLSPLSRLNLSGNKFTRIPDSLAQLSRLFELWLDDCSCLEVPPKLPCELFRLSIRNCPLLELFYKQMEMWRSSNEKLRSIDCSVVQAYFDYDGNPFKILHLHPQRLLRSERSFQIANADVACGPALVGSEIPKCFNDKSTNSFVTIQLHSDFGSDKYRKGYALFIVYEFHEPHSTHPRKRRKLKVDERKGNSNSTTIFDGSNSNLPNFVCQFQVNGVDVTKPLALSAPRVPSVGPNGFWVYIPAWWFDHRRNLGNSLDEYWISIEASITTSSLNVEVKECGARLVHDASELCQVLNSISPCALGLQSYENLFSLFDNSFLCSKALLLSLNVNLML